MVKEQWRWWTLLKQSTKSEHNSTTIIQNTEINVWTKSNADSEISLPEDTLAISYSKHELDDLKTFGFVSTFFVKVQYTHKILWMLNLSVYCIYYLNIPHALSAVLTHMKALELLIAHLGLDLVSCWEPLRRWWAPSIPFDVRTPSAWQG